MKKLALFLVLVLSLCACTPTQPTETDTTTKFTNKGFTLSIPNGYVDLLIVDTQREGQLFHVSEKASVEASKALFPNEPAGGGFLFGIGQVDEDTFHEMMSWGMTGADVFARDDKGNYYIYYHPTDVQLLRVEYTDADWEQWAELSEWAVQMKQVFIADNPTLTPYERTYSDVDCALHQIAYGDSIAHLHYSAGDAIYTPERAASMPYLEQLLDDVMYYMVRDGDFDPAGGYINLRVPNIFFTTFDFFTDEGQQQFIRLNMEGTDPLYLAASKDGQEFPAGKVVADWLASLA